MDTALVDTHEHLLRESTRHRGPGAHDLLPCDDAALLLHHYGQDDLAVCGMPALARGLLFDPEPAPDVKWRVLQPYWDRCRNTGYMRAVRHTVETLFDEPDLDLPAFVRISERMRDPGYTGTGLYGRLLDAAGVESCQVHSLETLLCLTGGEDGGRILPDLAVGALTVSIDLDQLERETGGRPASLGEMEALADGCFAGYARHAVAVKSLAGYERRLDFAAADPAVAAHAFTALAAGAAGEADRHLLGNHMMRHCLRRAAEHGLPVKLHCGLLAGHAHMSLERLRSNAADLCPTLVDFPETTFVLMHMGWPYQDEYIALAKHFPNVYVDLCWAWIVNPAAAVRFTREFLSAAPASKLLGFGGDYSTAECITGHAHIARRGIAQALVELVEGGWTPLDDALTIAGMVMGGNARRVFRLADRERDRGGAAELG
jgi:hypothetical protein